MFSIFKRELKSLFCDYRGYTFIGVFAICFCIVKMMYNYMLLYDTVYGFINHEYILMFLPAAAAFAVPVLTFSMYDIERKNGVFNFLRSLPVSDANIIFGKYLSRLAVMVAIYAFITVVEAVLGSYSGSTLSTVIFSIVSYILIANCLLAINVFIASVCKQKIVALIVGYGVSAVFTVLTAVRFSVSHTVAEILTPLSLFGTYTSGVFGMIDISYVILWISVGGVFTYLSYLFMKKEIRL